MGSRIRPIKQNMPLCHFAKGCRVPDKSVVMQEGNSRELLSFKDASQHSYQLTITTWIKNVFEIEKRGIHECWIWGEEIEEGIEGINRSVILVVQEMKRAITWLPFQMSVLMYMCGQLDSDRGTGNIRSPTKMLAQNVLGQRSSKTHGTVKRTPRPSPKILYCCQQSNPFGKSCVPVPAMDKQTPNSFSLCSCVMPKPLYYMNSWLS